MSQRLRNRVPSGSMLTFPDPAGGKETISDSTVQNWFNPTKFFLRF